jgi:hypothetical protein
MSNVCWTWRWELQAHRALYLIQRAGRHKECIDCCASYRSFLRIHWILALQGLHFSVSALTCTVTYHRDFQLFSLPKYEVTTHPSLPPITSRIQHPHCHSPTQMPTQLLLSLRRLSPKYVLPPPSVRIQHTQPIPPLRSPLHQPEKPPPPQSATRCPSSVLAGCRSWLKREQTSWLSCFDKGSHG